MMTFDFSSVPFRRELNRDDLERMRVPSRYWSARFDEISDVVIRKIGESTRDVVGKYINRMAQARSEGAGLVFWGDNGCGKTSAAVVIAKEYRRRGYTVLFMEAADLKRMVIEKEHFDEEETYWDRARSVDVLVLDDFGKGIMDSTGFGASIFDELIRARNSRQMVTIITSNLPTKEWLGELELKKSTMESLRECTYPLHVVGENKRDGSQTKLRELILS